MQLSANGYFDQKPKFKVNGRVSAGEETRSCFCFFSFSSFFLFKKDSSFFSYSLFRVEDMVKDEV